MKKTMKVANAVQQALFVCELMGQFSDGYWENSPGDHWRSWSDVEVVVANGDEPLGRNCYVTKDNYQINAKMLLEYVGDRMVLYARMALAGVPVDKIRDLEYAFGAPTKDSEGYLIWKVTPEGPDYTGAYWDDVRKYIATWNPNEFNKLYLIATNTGFDMKELKQQLALLKKTMKLKTTSEFV